MVLASFLLFGWGGVVTHAGVWGVGARGRVYVRVGVATPFALVEMARPSRPGLISTTDVRPFTP